MMTESKLIKNLNRKELMSYVPSGFKFKTKPYSHQLVGFLLGIYAQKGFMFFYDCGLGKTKILLDVFRYFRKTGECKRLLIVCLNSATGKMQEEVMKHTYCKPVILSGSKDERIIKYNSEHDVGIINFEGLQVMLCKLVTIKKGKQKGKRQHKPNAKLIRDFVAKYDMLVIDESQSIRNVNSIISVLCKNLSKFINRTFCDTGTPQEKSLLELWLQFYCADKGYALGDNYYKYRTMYFKDKGYWGPLYVPTEKGEKIIKSRMWKSAVRYAEDECLDLPKMVHRVVRFSLSATEQEQYDKIINGIGFSQNGNKLVIKNKVSKCRQLLGGFLYGENKSIIRLKNPTKLGVLGDTLNEIDLSRNKVVIFHEFVVEGRMIEELLQSLKVKYASLRGEIKNKDEQRLKFINDDKVRVLVAHPISGGFSVDLVVASYVIYYSNSDRWMVRYQCGKRIRRIGQKSSRVFYYDLLTVGTVDVGIYVRLRKKKNVFDDIYNDKNLQKFLTGV